VIEYKDDMNNVRRVATAATGKYVNQAGDRSVETANRSATETPDAARDLKADMAMISSIASGSNQEIREIKAVRARAGNGSAVFHKCPRLGRRDSHRMWRILARR
jgi:hypothetical protein